MWPKLPSRYSLFKHSENPGLMKNKCSSLLAWTTASCDTNYLCAKAFSLSIPLACPVFLRTTDILYLPVEGRTEVSEEKVACSSLFSKLVAETGIKLSPVSCFPPRESKYFAGKEKVRCAFCLKTTAKTFCLDLSFETNPFSGLKLFLILNFQLTDCWYFFK